MYGALKTIPYIFIFHLTERVQKQYRQVYQSNPVDSLIQCFPNCSGIFHLNHCCHIRRHTCTHQGHTLSLVKIQNLTVHLDLSSAHFQSYGLIGAQ